MADVDISGMPDPKDIGLDPAAQGDPTADMPDPEDIYRAAHFGPELNMNGKRGPMEPIPKDLVDQYMANPKQTTLREGLSAATGIPRAAAGYALAVPAGVASVVGQGTGALAAALDPDNAVEHLQQGNERGKEWANKVNTLADYVPATARGAQTAAGLQAFPGQVIKSVADTTIKPLVSDNAYQALGEVAQDVGTDLPALGAPGVVRATAKGASKVAGAAKDFYNTEKASVTAPEPTPVTKPDTGVGTPVTAESLRAQPNPIPPPEGTVAAVKQKVREAAAKPPETPQELGNQPQDMSLDPQARAAERARIAAERAKQIGLTGELEPEPVPANAAAVEGAAKKRDAMTDEERAAYDQANRIPTTGETAEQLQARLNAEADARGKTLGSRPAGNDERGSVRLFNPPADEGPQETPTPNQQSERAGHLDALDKLSGNLLPTRRTSALTGDYNATGNDYQMKEVGNEQMRKQIASENDALHAATENVHASAGSDFGNSVDSTTLGDRGRVIRNAIQGIEKHFDDRTDELYNSARASNQGRPIAKLERVQNYLNDDSNFTNDAEIGLQRAAKQRIQRLWTTGDPDKGAPPGSVNAAERLREFLNEKGKNPSAMGVASELKGHLDDDVAEHGGPGLFEAARNMRRYKYQMLEEPAGIKKLLAPSDSQGINHAIPEHKVADYIADLPREQHQQVMNVLRAGAHLDPELAKDSAAAIRELQAHTLSRIHAAATNADGTWNARKFHNAADRYARNMPETFKDRPDILNHLQTINKAGNTLAMDKHYPGAGAQIARTGVAGHLLEAGGALATGIAHDVPIIGRPIGRAIERGVEAARGKSNEIKQNNDVSSRLVDRTGKPLGGMRGSVQLFNDNDLNQGRDRDTFHGKTVERNPRTEYNANSQLAGGLRLTPEQQSIIDKLGGGRPLGERVGGGKQRGAVGEPSQRDEVIHEKDTRDPNFTNHRWTSPNGGKIHALDFPDTNARYAAFAEVPQGERGKGTGTRMLQRAVDDTHAEGKVWRSDKQVSDSQAGAYSNLKKLGYDVRTKDSDHRGGAYHAYGDHVFEVRPGASNKQRGSVRVMDNGEYEAPDELKNFIKKVAPPHRVDEKGPSNWEELQSRRHEKVMPINPQGAEGSIYGDVPTNIAFRAWHDKTHLDVNGGFDHDGELKTAIEQLRQAQKAGLSEESQRALWADTWETFKHHEDHGEFPANPRQFVAQRMQDTTPLGSRMGGKQRGSVRVMDDEEAPRSEEEGSQLNIGLHQGQEGDKNFRKMSKQEAQAAVESTGAKVTKNTVLTPKQHGVYEPTAVISTDRPLTDNEMRQVLAKTKQSAIPQRTGQGDESMHVAPGHEETAKKEGWDTFNPDYFREHDGRTMSDAMKNPAAPNPYPPHPDATVKDPVRSAFPGIYDDPKEIMARLGEGKPESPHLKEIFGKTRKDLHDDAIARGDVEPKTPIPGIALKGAGSAHAQRVKTPENAERIRSIIQAYKEHDPSGYHGMVGWYEMDPMYHSIKKILGGSKDAADKVFHTLNSLTAYASPMSDVGTEIKRGAAAATMAAEGNFDKFVKQGNLPQDKAPAALKAKNFELGNAGTMAHSSQAPAMSRFIETGQEANAVKTGTYRRSSDAPSRTGSEHQNTQPVGDSHWSRGVGLADVRGAKDFESSADGPEMKVLGKWFHDEVARHPDINLPSTSAQAVQWGALSKETGVNSPIGAPKLEIWADMIADAAKREGIPPREMWTRIVKRLAK